MHKVQPSQGDLQPGTDIVWDSQLTGIFNEVQDLWRRDDHEESFATLYRWFLDGRPNNSRVLRALSLAGMYSSSNDWRLPHTLGDAGKRILVQNLQEIQPLVTSTPNQKSNGFLRMLTVFFKALPVFLKTTLSFESFFSDTATVRLLTSADEDRTRAVARVAVETRRGVEALAIVVRLRPTGL
jgi:hypothetical protein